MTNPEMQQSSAETGFTTAGTADTFLAGDAVLDRVKSLARQITEKVRELIEDNSAPHLAEPAG